MTEFKDGTNGGVTGTVKTKLDQLDAYQQRHRWLAVPVAVARKFSEDQSTNLASMIAFWAIFSVFPLLLVFVTLLGFLVPDDLKNTVLGTVSSMFPMVDNSALRGLSGSWFALIFGLVTALWSGTAVVRITQDAFNSVWHLPASERPTLVRRVGRSLAVLATIGLGLVLTTVLSGFITTLASALHLGWLGNLLGYAIAIALDVGLFIAAFRILTDRSVTMRDVLPGALLTGVLFWVLQSLSSLIIGRYVAGASRTYGQFATVITLLWWFYLQSVITVLGAQLNVVLKERLHPRALTATSATG
ncbi:YihY/virulence factor BrkB family protein [Amycolatopsis pigmentata]|uniref:YihY/virulence factor BrkB family protein n=1 Tax=Amycolatopsis pigmentata TaxID=450801 RepID=A0ABW5FK64_9PSEU